MRESANMGMESSLGKDERKFQLKSAIDKGQVYTLQSAAQLLRLSEGTISQYLTELGLQLWDPKKDKFVGAKDGQQVGIDIQPI